MERTQPKEATMGHRQTRRKITLTLTETQFGYISGVVAKAYREEPLAETKRVYERCHNKLWEAWLERERNPECS